MGKYIAVNAYTEEQKNISDSTTNLQFKELEKEQTKSNASRWRK